MPFPPHSRYQAPFSMILALLTAALLVTAHHLFYAHLANQPAATGSFYNSPISKQEANIAIGTTLAFLVKACLVFAMSVVFVQVFWREAKYAVGQPVTLERLDGMYAAFTSVVSLGNVVLWWRFPLLLGMAGCAWYVLSNTGQ